jgi:hypothetical protein
MNKRDVLAAITFGQRIAEDEADALVSYFVETDQWRKLISGNVDVIYGPKGSGKSALYSLLRKKREELLARNIIPVAGEKVRGSPVFEDLIADPPDSEEQFRHLWKLYFLSLIGTIFRYAKIDNEYSRRLLPLLEGAQLVHTEWSLKRSLRAALDYARRVDSVSGMVKINPASGAPEGVEAKVTLREPSREQRSLGYASADALIEIGDRAFGTAGKKFWVVLDRLDVAFAESIDLERNALRALFRVYRDMAALESISLKIFLRDDIWARITSAGFREASHITRSITITWDPRSLLYLVIRRALHNDAICEYYNVDRTTVLASIDAQQELFYRIFPAQVERGERKSTTFDWMLARTTDGTGKTAPRELIHLLVSARDEQLRLLRPSSTAGRYKARYRRCQKYATNKPSAPSTRACGHFLTSWRVRKLSSRQHRWRESGGYLRLRQCREPKSWRMSVSSRSVDRKSSQSFGYRFCIAMRSTSCRGQLNND